jgi:ATP-binding cassette, subfamily B, bacterial
MSLLRAAGIDSGHGPGRFAAGDTGGRRSVDWRVLRRILSHTRPYAFRRNLIFGLTALRAAQKPALAWALAAVISGPVTRGDLDGLQLGALGFLLLAAFTELTFHFRQRLSLELGEAVVHDLRNAVFQRLQSLPLGYYNRTKLGRILSRVITDIESVRRGVQGVFFFSLLLVGQMLGAACLMLAYNPLLFGLLLVIGPFVWMVNRHFHPKLLRLSRAVAESQSRVTGTLAESIRGVRVIQSFDRAACNDRRFGELAELHAGNNVGLARESSLHVPLLDASSQLFIASMLLVGGWAAVEGRAGIDIGSLIAFLFLPNLFFQSLQHLAQLHTQVLTAVAGAERVFELIDQKPDWAEPPGLPELPDPRRPAPARAPDRGARVEFQHVSFGYEPGRPVLHAIDFTAEPGQRIALVGHTGSGKSTVLNLLAKFYLPWEGVIRIDGRPLDQIRGDSVRRQMGIVLQTNFLFTGTVEENLRLGRPEATADEIRAAARALDCLDLLEALPRGLATEVGERGASLSLGQRQLICFTRALLANPRIVILDEATSSVDTITESRLQRALERLLDGRTSFIVAHRLSTVRQADRTLVLEEGRIVESGAHAALLSRRGPYRALYEQFASGAPADGRAVVTVPPPAEAAR